MQASRKTGAERATSRRRSSYPAKRPKFDPPMWTKRSNIGAGIATLHTSLPRSLQWPKENPKKRLVLTTRTGASCRKPRQSYATGRIRRATRRAGEEENHQRTTRGGRDKSDVDWENVTGATAGVEQGRPSMTSPLYAWELACHTCHRTNNMWEKIASTHEQ